MSEPKGNKQPSDTSAVIPPSTDPSTDPPRTAAGQRDYRDHSQKEPVEQAIPGDDVPQTPEVQEVPLYDQDDDDTEPYDPVEDHDTLD